MKKSNLISRLLSYSHEKQSPQRFARYAVMLIMLLTLGVGQARAYSTLHFAQSNDDCGMSDWSTSAYQINNTSTGNGSIFIFVANSTEFKIVQAGSSWYGYETSSTLDTDDAGQHFKSESDKNCTYNGNSGIVEVHSTQTGSGNNDAYPWIWITKPSYIYIRHNWNNSGESNQAMTDNEDGTYKYTGVYGGSNSTKIGPCSDCSSGSSTFKTLEATLVGSPAVGNSCIFEYDACGYVGIGTTTQNTGSLTITKLCKVTYDGNGKESGTVPGEDANHKYNNSVTLSSNNLTKTGYSHTGWNTKADGSGTHYAKGASLTVTDVEHVLYAEWTPDWALYNNDDLLGVFTKSADKDYYLNVTLTNENCTAIHYKKDGATWYYTGADDPTTMNVPFVAGDGKLNWSHDKGSYKFRIQWDGTNSRWYYTAQKKAVLIYDANGATSGSAPSNEEYTPGTSVTTANSSMTKSSFTLTGWNTKADGSGTHYDLDESDAFTISSNMTLYAEWTPSVPSAVVLAGTFIDSWNTCVAMDKNVDGSITTFTYTFYDLAAGTYNFGLKPSGGCGNSTFSLKATSGVTMTQTGCTSLDNSGDSNDYFRVVTGSAGDVTITATYDTDAKTITMNVTRVTPSTSSSGFYLHGEIDSRTDWCSSGYWPSRWPVNRSYRGISGCFYRPIADIENDDHFGVHDGSNKYSGDNSGSDFSYSGGRQNLVVNDSKCFVTTTAFHNKWVIVKTTGTKQIWVQNPTTYYTITLANGTSGNVLSGAQGTVALTENSYGNLATKQYASGERVNISITAASGYKITKIQLGETVVESNVNNTTYSGYTTMPSGDATLTVTYTPIDYEITLDKNDGASNGSVTATFNSTSTKSFTAVTRTGYNCTGYWTATSGGTKVVNADGSLVGYTSAVSDYLNTDGTWKKMTETTLYAQWTPKEYTISLAANNASATGGTATVNYNATSISITSAPAWVGHHITGYYKEAGCTNKVVGANNALESDVEGYTTGTAWTKDADATLYTEWAANTYSVSFDANDGEGSIDNQDFTYGVAQNLTSNNGSITRQDYFFDGWATSPGGDVAYADGESVSDLTSTHEGTYTLYAHWKHVPALSSVTTTPASYNYVDEDITLNLSATSTYLEHPIVVFFVNDGVATYQVTAAAYGDGDDAVGTIGSDAAYTTVHKATFAVKAAGTYSVTAKLYEGELVDNFEGTNAKGWAGDNLGVGGITFGANNPGRMAGNGSSKVLEVTRTSGLDYGGAIMVFVASADDKDDCDATGSNDYEYIHARMKDATSATRLKNNDAAGNTGDITPSFTGDASADWRHVTYYNTHCSNNFLYFMIQRDDTDNKTVYIDDVILSNNETWAPVKDEEDEDVTAAASPVVINQTYDISIVGGRVASDNSATSVKASADVTNPLVGTADVIGVDVPFGMKFVGWKLSTGVSLKDGYELTDHAIQFYALGNGTVTAQYEKRNHVHVYFAEVPGWDHVYAYVWQNSNTSNKNATYPGVELTVTSEYDGITYYYYGYYTEGTGLGDAAPGDAAWDRIIFNNGTTPGTEYGRDGWNKTLDLELVNGHYYHFADDESGSEYYYDWYVMGRWNGAATWNYTNPIDYTNTAIVRDLNTEKQSFKIYRASTNEWFKYDPDGDSADEEDAAVIGSAMTLSKGVANNNIFTPDTKAGYQFSLVKDNTSPTLTIQKMTDQDISVTVEAGANGSIETGASTIHLYTTTTIEAAANAGYRFEKWTVDDAHKSYIHIEDTTNASTKVYAKYGSLGNGATITAHFTNEGIVYLDKSAVPGWGDKAYITFFTNTDHWEDYYDTERKVHINRVHMKNYVPGLMSQEMTLIEGTTIYYYDYHEHEVSDMSQFAFHNKYVADDSRFWEMAAVARGDFNKTNNLFVVENYVQTDIAKTGYYYGYWMKYREEEAGIKLKLYDGSNQLLYGSPFTFTREDLSTNTFTTTIKLNGSSTYRIELLGDNGIYYKHNNTYKTTDADALDPYWDYVEREATVGYITTTGEGEYTFTLNCTNQLKMATAYPLKAGDYRIVYNGKINSDAATTGDFNGSPIAQWTSGTQIDKVSFFVADADAAGMDWNLRIQSCSIDGTTVSWSNVDETVYSFSTLNGDTGVYVFDVKQTSEGITIENPVKYTGDYYIRTDIADGRWEAYKEAENNKMVHSDWAEEHYDYNYYHCHYTPSGKSVKFTIANDYSSSISGELNSDDYTTGDGKLNANANVRFSYNSATNVIKRTYIGGSADDTYLNIVSPTSGYVYASNGTTDLNGASAYTRKFVDMGNWVYQLDVQAYPTSQARVTAYYNGDTQYLIGSSTTSETIIGGADKGTKKYKLRIVYDFKNNHLISSWLADGTQINENITLNADLMIVRHLQEAGVQITFDNSTHSVSGIKTIYGAIRFDYNDMVNQMPNWNASGIYGKVIYFISFPFDVNVKDIFGSAGNIDDQWIIQSYNGARRAKEGWFADSEPFWETLTVDSVMKAGRGYALIIDRPSFNDPSSVVWTNKSAGSSVYLYFPSHNADAATIGIGSKTITVPAHKCEIERSFYNSSSVLVSHTLTDSHWNMMGVPLFENKVASTVVEDGDIYEDIELYYFYDWNAGTNTYDVMSTGGTPFKAMHGYMVQFAGDVTFSGAALNPSAIVAAHHVADKKKYRVELQMTNENGILSRTYVELRENACDTFLLNEDVYMMRSSTTVDLFTLAGNYDVAANVLPIQNHTVPVGMDVKQAGMYTFSMPSNFSGTVTLLDTQAGTRTNLALEDYQVYLNQGPINGRFFLVLDIQESTTSLEEITGEGSIKDGGVHKFLKGGQMFILKNGVIYDAKGNRVK